MRRLTGFLFFSLLCLLPLRIESKEKDPDCPSGTRLCDAHCCVPLDTPCSNARCILPIKIVPLEKLDNTMFSLPEGTLFQCAGNAQAILHTDDAGRITYTCGPAKESTPEK